MSAAAPEEFGPYLVYEEIGMGGMAAVHRAETRGIEGFSKPVALKRMLPSMAANSDFVEAFIREARIASHLRHVNVAQTYELGKVDGIYFIAMELVTGRNLRQILRHCAQLTGQMPVAVTLNILNQICDALDYAHNLCDSNGARLNIIHRDVSPSNIIVSEGGLVKLIDFGIAKASAAGMQTMSGMLKGKFGYMAPEYIAGAIDARADLFAVGVIAHELLTNRPLFTHNDDMETLDRVRSMPIKPPSAYNRKVPKEIDELVMTALARDPDRRWQHATALRTALTTMTKRLKLDVMNSEVGEWIDWVFEQGKRDDFVDMGGHDTTTDIDPPEQATVLSRGPGPGAIDPLMDDSVRTTTQRPVEPASSALATSTRTLLGTQSAPHISLAALAPRQGSVPPRRSDPNIPIRPSAPNLAALPSVVVKEPTPNPALDRVPASLSIPPSSFGASVPPGHLRGPNAEATKIVAPPGQPARAGGDHIAVIAFLVIVVAAATAVVFYFAMT